MATIAKTTGASTYVEAVPSATAHGARMTFAIPTTSPHVWRFVFAATALWTLLGAIPGYLDPLASFMRFYGAPPDSPLVLELYRGAWGQTLLFAVGYAFAAIDPRRHSLVLVLGGVGKILYALRVLVSWEASTTMALVAALGDLVFVALIATFLFTTGAGRSLVSLRGRTAG